MDRLDALKVFCTVVESGGFSKAADRLGMSTSSVTNQVAALEQHFRAKLLNRTTRSMSVTDEGRQCYDSARLLLADMGELESNLQSASQAPRGSLRVDMPGIISRQLVAPALPGFLAAYPDITLRMSAGDRMIDMVEEGVDVLVRIGELPSSNLVARTLSMTRFVCCASPAFIERHGTPRTPAELDAYPCLNFVLPKSRQTRAWLFRQAGEGMTHTPQGVLASDHVESLVAAAVAGAGIIQVLSISVHTELASGALVPLLAEWEAPGPAVSALFQQKHHRAAKVKVFVDFLASLFERR
jgi:LysR family transcriptional regulator for bpeEF and oprC